MPELAIFMPLAQASAPAGNPGVAVERPAPAAGQPVSVTVTSAPGTSTSQPAGPRGFFDGGGGMLMIIPMLLVLYFVLFRGQRKTEKKRKDMVAQLKKGDRIMTIGGMLAKVVSVDGDEVVLKIDEAANVKATYRKSSIQEVIDDEKK